MTDFLVFTDLDGTLLDHDTYSFDEALPALNMLEEHACPVIFNSSKTASEISQLRQEIHNIHPFIVENGSAVYIPDGYFDCADIPQETVSESLSVHSFGPGYQELLSTLHRLRSQHGYTFQGFSDLSAAEVAEITGLTPEDAEKAKDRAASEPLSWDDSEDALIEFTEKLEQQELTLTRGGRFYHVMGQTDKASALRWLTKKFQASWPTRRWTTVALGDGPNDQQMLEATDIAVVIPAASGKTLQLNRTERVIYPEAQGPRGWQVAIEQIFQQSSSKGA